MIKLVDRFLLFLVQKLCDWFQQMTGLTKFRLEKWCHITRLAFFLTLAILIPETIMLIIAAAMICSVYFDVRDIERQERLFLINGHLEFRAEMVDALRARRVVVDVVLLVIVFFVSSPINVMLSGWIISGTFITYLACMTPKPPSKSTMGEWLKKSLSRIKSLFPRPAFGLLGSSRRTVATSYKG